MQLNIDDFYDNGNLSGKLSKSLRELNPITNTEALRSLITAMKTVGTADGTVATLVTALTTVETELATPATFNKIVEAY